MSRCPEPPGWSKSAKGSPSTTCQGGRSKHASRGPRRQREGPADRDTEEGRERGARRGWSVGGAGCPEKRGAYLRVDLWRQPPSSGWRGKSTIDTSSRPMMIDDDDESVGPAGTPKTTSWTRAAYASSSVDPFFMPAVHASVLDDQQLAANCTVPRPACSDSTSATGQS